MVGSSGLGRPVVERGVHISLKITLPVNASFRDILLPSDGH